MIYDNDLIIIIIFSMILSMIKGIWYDAVYLYLNHDNHDDYHKYYDYHNHNYDNYYDNYTIIYKELSTIENMYNYIIYLILLN